MSTFKKITYLFLLIIVFSKCTGSDSYLIDKGKVGMLTSETKVNEIEMLFPQDSIVNKFAELENVQEGFFDSSDDYEIFSKDSGKLLSITPMKINDSVSKIKSIQIFDSKFKTKKGICLSSTFKEIQDNYKINKVETTLTSATLYIDELNATISIDKESLGMTKFNTTEITIDQIPDVSKIKYFTVWFN